MKRLLCAASLIALIVPSVAGAQQQDRKHHNGQSADRQGHHGRRGQHNGKPTIQPVPNRPNRPGHNRPPTIQPVPNRPGRPHHVRPIRGPVYHYPRGHHYRRWSIGLVLPHIFLSSPYYYNDWSAFGLYPPPRGYRWVRYGPDLLLVNVYTGRIRDVVYGAFY